MFRWGTHLTTALAAVVAAGLLSAQPAVAQAAQPVVGPTLPPSASCLIPWTNVIVGTDQSDVLIGTSGNDLIMGHGGDDTIYGLGGRDTILGGPGDDVLVGGPGNDCILGGEGDDVSVLFTYTQPNGTDDSQSVAFRYDY
jgi:Ca2+-binding RTX toxin-like protein